MVERRVTDRPPVVDTLRSRLLEYNHWWRDDVEPEYDLPGVFDPLEDYRSLQGDFFYAVDNVIGGDRDLVGLSGPPGVGKTTIVQQLVRLFVDEELKRQIETLADVREGRAPPERDVDHLAWGIHKYNTEYASVASEYGPDQVCYLPLDADTTNQIRADEQIARAIERYETEILDGDADETEHAVLIDDIHTVASGSGPTDGNWGTIVEALLEGRPQRTVLITAVADLQIDRELAGVRSDGTSLDYRIREIAPPKFSDYAQRRYPVYEGDDSEEPGVEISDVDAVAAGSVEELEGTAHPDTYRLRSSPLRRGLYAGAIEGSAAELWDRLEDDRFAEDAVVYDVPRLRQCFREYLLLGGLGSFALPDEVLAVRDPEEFVARLDDGRWRESAAQTRASIRTALHREATSFRPIKNVRNLERLFGWAANERPIDPVPYGRLHGGPTDDALFGVDRRTLREKYFGPLSRLDILTPSEEYDNQRPTAVRPAPRDVGVVNAVTGRGVRDVVAEGDDTGSDDPTITGPELRAELAYLVAFDHVVRLTYVINDDWDPKQGVVKYWRSAGGSLVDFVPRFRGAPVPIAVAYPEDQPTLGRKRAALYEFLDRDSFGDTDRFDPPVDDSEAGVETLDELTALDSVGQGTLDALRERGYESLEALSEATSSDLVGVPGIGRSKAATILDAVESASGDGLFQRRLAELREGVSGPDYVGDLRERTFAEGSDTGRTTTHYQVVDGPAPFGILLTEETRRLVDPDDDDAIIELPLWEFLAGA